MRHRALVFTLCAALCACIAIPVHAEIPPGPLLTWGTLGSGLANLDHPYGIASDASGNLYVSDQHNHRVMVYDGDGNLLAHWGSFGTGPGQMSYPTGIAVASDGYVYVTENQGQRISKFTTSGVPVGVFGTGLLAYPVGIALDASNNLYVVQTGPSWSPDPRIWVFSPTGALLGWYGTYGSGPGQLISPYGIDIVGSTMYVSDIDNQRVTHFGLDGSYLGSWGTYGAAPGQFYGCEGIAHDNAGNLFVCDTGNNRVQKFTSSGTLLSVFGLQGNALGQLYTPSDVALDSNGAIYVAEWNNARIQKWMYGDPTPVHRITWGALKTSYR